MIAKKPVKNGPAKKTMRAPVRKTVKSKTAKPLAKKTGSSKSTKSRLAPNLNEVSCGYIFSAPIENIAEYYGELTQLFKSDGFSGLEFQPLIMRSIESKDQTSTEMIVTAAQRMWLIDPVGGFVLQFQVDRVHLNWRDTDGGKDYPLFDGLLTKFELCFEKFQKFMKSKKSIPKLEQVELTYVNSFPKNEGWKSLAKLHSIFPFVSDLNLNAEPDAVFYKTATWDDMLGMRLHSSLQTGVRIPDHVKILQLSFTARGKGKKTDYSSGGKWLKSAHDRVHETIRNLQISESLIGKAKKGKS